MGTHSWQEGALCESKKADILSVVHIRDNQGAFWSQEKSGLNLTELEQPLLSRRVNVKVTINLADNYFHVYWQEFSSGLKTIVSHACLEANTH